MDTPIRLQVSVEGNQVIFDFADDAEAQQWNNRLRRKRKKLLFSPYGLCFLALGKDERIAFQMEAEDVSEENLGFDIRSHDKGEIRRIEVKGRARMGSVRLSSNEWMQAKQLGESFWLYIVVNCATKPQLYVLQDPAAKLKPHEEVVVTSYLIEQRSWHSAAERRDFEYRVKGGGESPER